MKKEELNTDKMFREKMEGFSVEPPSHIWNNIQDQLAVLQRKRRLAYARWITAAAVVILAFLAGWYFNDRIDELIPNRVENQFVQPRKTLPLPENNVTKKQEPQVIPQNKTIETDKLVVAASNATKTNAEETSTRNKGASTSEKVQQENTKTEASFFQKFNMQKIRSKKIASFHWIQPEFSLGKSNEEIISADQLTEAEKVLVSENAKRYSEPKEKEGNWKMGLSVSPGYASHVTSHSDNYASNMTYSGSEGNRNVSGGFSVQYKTGKKWSVESGIYYAQNGQRSSNSPVENYNNLLTGSAFDTEKSYFNTAVNMSDGQMAMNSTAGIIEFSGTPRGTELATIAEDSNTRSNTLITSSEFSQVFDFIEIPLYLRYNLIDAKIGVQVLGGVNAGIVAGNNVFMENSYGTQNVGKTQDISTLNIAGTIGFGVNYDLSRHISMSVEPRLNYYFNSINQNPDVTFRPYRIGLYTGLYYQF